MEAQVFNWRRRAAHRLRATLGTFGLGALAFALEVEARKRRGLPGASR